MLKDKIAIITGAAKGIGLACAERFVADGARVVIADIDETAGNAAVKKLGASARFIACNVGSAADVKAVVEKTIATLGGIDVLVNNAGIVSGADFLDVTEEAFDQVLRVNLKGSFLMGQAVARYMVDQEKNGKKPGVIVNMSSVNAVFAIPTQVPYSISKGGINQLTKVMSLSLASYGIRVNAIGPGSIMTEMLASVNSDPAARTRLLSRTPMGRMGEPSEIASIAAFLASDDASY
ncbi:MAG: SDR family NAD(P)-dependent oxidoreductase, partial [Parvibaculaceae bacterium]